MSLANKMSLNALQIKAVQHSLYSLFLGLVGGIFLIYSALDQVVIWPVGQWAWTLPGEVSLWRALHVGPLLNGVMAIALIYLSQALAANSQQREHIAVSMIIMVWGNGLFYLLRIWGNARGLAMQSEQFSAGNWADFFAMLAAVLAMVSTFYALFVLFKICRQSLWSAHE